MSNNAGKGHKSRPFSVSYQEFSNNWDLINWNSKRKWPNKKICQNQPEIKKNDQDTEYNLETIEIIS